MSVVTDNSKVTADVLKERDELKAQICVANKVIEVLAETDSEKIIAQKWFETAPRQSLAAIKARAIEELMIDYMHVSPAEPVSFIQNKINKLRKQAE
jgi:cobalamin biosynthesis Co2+ chelatase CbiK